MGPSGGARATAAAWSPGFSQGLRLPWASVSPSPFLSPGFLEKKNTSGFHLALRAVLVPRLQWIHRVVGFDPENKEDS